MSAALNIDVAAIFEKLSQKPAGDAHTKRSKKRDAQSDWENQPLGLAETPKASAQPPVDSEPLQAWEDTLLELEAPTDPKKLAQAPRRRGKTKRVSKDS